MVTAFSFEDIIILLLLLYYSVNPLGLYQILNTVVLMLSLSPSIAMLVYYSECIKDVIL